MLLGGVEGLYKKNKRSLSKKNKRPLTWTNNLAFFFSFTFSNPLPLEEEKIELKSVDCTCSSLVD